MRIDNRDTPGKFVGAVENAVRILHHLAHSNASYGVASIARETRLNVSTTFNILRTLWKEGLVVFDPETKTYRLGLGVLTLSVPLLGTNQAGLLHPELERLSHEHNALIGLWKITPNDRIILVDRIVSENVVRIDMRLGSRLPAFAGAVGRCIAATRNLSKEKLRQRFNMLRWQSPPTFKQYAEDVRTAARRGYAFDFGQLFRGLDIAASVIRDHNREAQFGISGIAIAGQLSRAELTCLAEAISETTGRISNTIYGRALAHVADCSPATAIGGQDRTRRPGVRKTKKL